MIHRRSSPPVDSTLSSLPSCAWTAPPPSPWGCLPEWNSWSPLPGSFVAGCPECTRPRDTRRAKGPLASAREMHFAGRHRGSAQDRGEAVWGSGQNGSRSRRPSCRLPAVGPRTSHAASLCLGFLTCKQGMLTVPTSRGSRKDQIEDFEECVPDSKFCPSGGSANVLWSN